jgi:hypothetical protein
VPTSVPTTVHSTVTQGMTTTTIPTGLEQENLLMQHYHYQYLQSQLLLRYGKLLLCYLVYDNSLPILRVTLMKKNSWQGLRSYVTWGRIGICGYC